MDALRKFTSKRKAANAPGQSTPSIRGSNPSPAASVFSLFEGPRPVENRDDSSAQPPPSAQVFPEPSVDFIVVDNEPAASVHAPIVGLPIQYEDRSPVPDSISLSKEGPDASSEIIPTTNTNGKALPNRSTDQRDPLAKSTSPKSSLAPIKTDFRSNVAENTAAGKKKAVRIRFQVKLTKGTQLQDTNTQKPMRSESSKEDLDDSLPQTEEAQQVTESLDPLYVDLGEGDVFSWKFRIPPSGTVTVGGPADPGSLATTIPRDVAEVPLPKHVDHVPANPEDGGVNPYVSMDLWKTINPPQDDLRMTTSPPPNTFDPVDSSGVDKLPTETPETQRTPDKGPISDSAPTSPSKEHPAGASASPTDGKPTKEVPPEPALKSPAPKSPGPVPPVSMPPETVSPDPVSQGPVSPTAEGPGPESPGLVPPTSPASDPIPEPVPVSDPVVPEQTGSSLTPPEEPAPQEPAQEVPQPTPTTPAVTPPDDKPILPCLSIDIDADENIWLEAYIENRADNGTEEDLESDFMCRISQNEVLCLRMGPDNGDANPFNESGRVVEAITTSDGVTDVIVTANHDGRTRPIRRWRIPKHKTVCVKVVANEKIALPALASVKAIDGKSMGLHEHQVEQDTTTRFPDGDSPVGNGRTSGFGARSLTHNGDV